MKKLKLVLPMLLAAGVIGCSFIDMEATAVNDKEPNAQDNLAGVLSHPTDFTNQRHDNRPLGSAAQSAHTDYQQSASHASIKPKRPANEPVSRSYEVRLKEFDDKPASQNYDDTLESLANEDGSQKYSVKLGGRNVGPAKPIVESQSAQSNPSTLTSYTKSKPALARHNKLAGKLSRRGKMVYLTNRHTSPGNQSTELANVTPAAIKSNQLAKDAVTAIKSTPLAKDTAPATNPTRLAKATAPEIKPAMLAKDTTPATSPSRLIKEASPEINANSLATDAIPLINSNRWVIGE